MLSPTLFNVFLDDLLGTVQLSGAKTLAFADDVVIIAQGKVQLLTALNQLEKWSVENCMTINRSKSAILVIRADKKTPNDLSPIRGIPITEKYKYLGLEVSDCADARALKERLRRQTKQLTTTTHKMAFSALPASTKLLAWRVLVAPKFLYALTSVMHIFTSLK